jgi:hypothetical protein
MCLALALLLASPAAAHSGRIVRDGFELSDVALFAFACIGIWLAQRSMRRRARARDRD